jgi:DNA-binding response OmpR family regulator
MKLKILIVEDENIVAMHMRLVAERLGHEVVSVVPDAQRAVAAARSRPCDLLLCDIRLGGGTDGIEAAAMIRSIRECELVYITAYRDPETLKRAAETDFIGYLVKPFREEELETLIQLAAMRRASGSCRKTVHIDETYDYCFDCATLFRDGEGVELTAKEHRLLRSLLESPGELVSYERLDLDVWGESPIDANTRRQLVHRLKQKAPYFPLKLVKGFGYRIEIAKQS